MFKKLGLFLILLSFCSCSPEHIRSSDLSSGGGGIVPNPNPDPALKAAAEAVLVDKCVSCHGGGASFPQFLNTAADPRIDDMIDTKYVSIGKSSASLLYQRANDGTMPSSSNPLSSADADKIKAWIDDLGIETGGGSSAATFSEVESQILAPKCYSCHTTAGPSKPAFSDYDSVMYSVVSPNNLNSALYISVARTSDPMPKNGTPLTTEEIDLIESWIMDGAPNN